MMGNGSMGLKVVFCVGMACVVASAGVTFTNIGDVLVTDMSADGRVLVGNTAAAYETFLWTSETGVVPLGRATQPTLGVASGSPDVSDDGTRISGTILSDDGLYATQGLWSMDSGWQELPMPADTNPSGASKSSAWGLSGDGNTLVGLYWRGGMTDGGAHASKWTETGGTVDLGSSGGNSRANDANYDGSVIVGWDEADWGGWQPTVWRDGEMTRIREYNAFCSAEAVSPDGSIVSGTGYDRETGLFNATIWRWDGEDWGEETLGVLPGTLPEEGKAIALDMSADGSVMVGFNQYNYFGGAGFIWTEEDGMVHIRDFLLENGIEVDPNLNLQTVTSISDDGMTIAGIAQEMVYPFAYSSFLITIPEPASLALLAIGCVMVVRRR